MHVKRESICFVLALMISALLVMSIVHVSGDAPAQTSSGDVLSIFFKDARAVLGKSLITRADSYYHGGVTMGDSVYCTEDHDHAHDDEGEHSHDEHPDHVDEAAIDTKHVIDPWGWLNARIHVQEHRHLHGEEIEEIIPWIWAACRASPHNIEAYGMGWYVLTKMRKHPDAGLAVLQEGIRNNPDDLDLAFTLGQSFYTDMKDQAAAESAFLLVREKAFRKSKQDLTRLSEDDGRSLASALMYLTRLAEARGDIEAMRAYFEEARTAAPNYAATQGIARMIEEWEADRGR